MQKWVKIHSAVVPKQSFDTIFVECNDSGLSLLCKPASKLDDALTVKVTFDKSSLVAFEWKDDCFEAITQDPVEKDPSLTIGNGCPHLYPYLEVLNSSWLMRRPVVKDAFPGIRHFLFASEFAIVEVLARKVPNIEKFE